MTPSTVVVGGGIGGLAAAVALQQVGKPVMVLERATAPGEIGAGLSLWSNALRALDALGIGPALRAAGTMQASGGIRTSSGRWLSRSSAAALQERSGVTVLVVHRAELHRLLRAALPADAVRYAAEVTDVESDGATVRVHFRTPDGVSVIDAPLVVAADGLDSGVRRRLWPDSGGSVYAGFTAWRGVTAGPVHPAPEAGVTWGPGSEFGVAPMPDGRVYWFGTANLSAGGRAGDEHAEVVRRFGRWPAPIPALLAGTAADAVLHHDIRHLASPLPTFVSGRVALLGDAVHAMTPNLGQGACQALEDAVVLAAALAADPDVETALRTYDESRRPRAQAMARSSYRMSRLIQTESRLVRTGRNALVRATPQRAAMASLRRLTDWTPPP